MKPYCPKRILVQEESWQDPATRRILHRLPGISVDTVKRENLQDAWAAVACQESSEPKNILILKRYPGKFLKICQGSGAEICCGYWIVSYAWNCPLDCTYCVLQAYLKDQAIVIFTNIEQLLAEVDETLTRFPGQIFRIGSGELADSLAVDHLTNYTRELVSLFARHANGILELKTKTDQIANLENLDHAGRTMVSWSMNSKPVCDNEERKAATFEERLSAALRCQQWGYKLAFHFDPLIHYEGWEADYREAVERIFHTVDPGQVAYVSLGALRFTPHLRDIIRERSPESKILDGEFVPGHHGKLRYFRPIREEMYRKMRSWIRTAAPEVFVYLCMESGVVWERSLGERPRNTAHLCQLLAARCLTAW